MFALVPAALALVCAVRALPQPEAPAPHALPRRWFHPPAHPVHELFRRQSPASPPAPGSPEWRAQYPTATLPPLDESQIPAAWRAALAAAEHSGAIPANVPVSALPPGGFTPVYPGDDPSGHGPAICSSYAKCRAPDDVWDAPPGHVGIGFDDGPSEGSTQLYTFLQQNNQSATHFMIGLNILNNYPNFQQAVHTLQDDIGVHTWTHPYMTTLNNTQVLAQLGWTMQIIHDSTGGRVPRFWRPPYGDSDNRVRAIARTVFNLTQINWNQDSADWTIRTGATTRPRVAGAISQFYTGPKSPGLIILEHELTPDTVGAFMDSYAGLQSNGWTATSVVDLLGGSWQNAPGRGDAGPLQRSMDVVSPVPTTASSSAVATATAGGSFNNNNKTGTAPHASGARRRVAAVVVPPSSSSALVSSALAFVLLVSVHALR